MAIYNGTPGNDTYSGGNASDTIDGPPATAALDIVGDGTAAGAATRVIYDPSSGGVYFDADGDGGTAAVPLATLLGSPPLGASDIVAGA